jgi:hypothetical protein
MKKGNDDNDEKNKESKQSQLTLIAQYILII